MVEIINNFSWSIVLYCKFRESLIVRNQTFINSIVDLKALDMDHSARFREQLNHDVGMRL